MEVREMTRVDKLEGKLAIEKKNRATYERGVRVTMIGRFMSDFEMGFTAGKYEMKLKEAEERITEYEGQIRVEIAKYPSGSLDA